MYIIDSLKSISGYPIPLNVIERVCEDRGFNFTSSTDNSEAQARAMTLARADLFIWLSMAPNVSQGGQSYSFNEEQRNAMRATAQRIYKEQGEANAQSGMVTYGYKGERL